MLPPPFYRSRSERVVHRTGTRNSTWYLMYEVFCKRSAEECPSFTKEISITFSSFTTVISTFLYHVKVGTSSSKYKSYYLRFTEKPISQLGDHFSFRSLKKNASALASLNFFLTEIQVEIHYSGPFQQKTRQIKLQPTKFFEPNWVNKNCICATK